MKLKVTSYKAEERKITYYNQVQLTGQQQSSKEQGYYIISQAKKPLIAVQEDLKPVKPVIDFFFF